MSGTLNYVRRAADLVGPGAHRIDVGDWVRHFVVFHTGCVLAEFSRFFANRNELTNAPDRTLGAALTTNHPIVGGFSLQKRCSL